MRGYLLYLVDQGKSSAVRKRVISAIRFVYRVTLGRPEVVEGLAWPKAPVRNRHCPRCQWGAQQRWIAGRLERVLDTHYFHVVFTLPSELRALAMSSPREIYGLLFRAASRTLLELGRDPKWLGAELGLTMVLHTWTRDLRLHPHVHCLVTGGGLSDDGQWIAARQTFFAPVQVIGALFRGKFLAGLKSLRRRGLLRLEGPASDFAEPDVWAEVLTRLYASNWVVYAKRPMAGAEQVVTYLGRYTHRVAISNSRLLDVTDERVVFRTRGDKTASLSVADFVSRFLLHVLPRRFVKIRHYGLFAAASVQIKAGPRAESSSRPGSGRSRHR